MNSSPLINLSINGTAVQVTQGTSVAAAIIISGSDTIREAIDGSGRGPLCGMGVCYECRATVNGNEFTRTCMMQCSEGMEVVHA